MQSFKPFLQRSKHTLVPRVGTAAAIGALLIGFSAGEQAKADPTSVVCDKRFAVHHDDESLDLAYCANFDLEAGDPSFKRAIIVVHGAGRGADLNFRKVRDAGIAADGADQTTAIVAPHFLTEEDIDSHSVSEDVLFWSSSGWKIGDLSKDTTGNPRPFRISSFKVLDQILESLADNKAYPGITEIVVAGHSAGGQFSQRYAAGGAAQDNLAAVRPDLSFRYVVANPSSYVYLSPERVEQGTKDSFSVPNSKGCSSYNDYKYGLEDLNSYMSEAGPDVIKQRYQSRQVVTLLGLEDNDPNHPDLEKNCSAMFQGAHRLERGEIHFNHVQDLFGPQILSLHHLDYVPGVGHSVSGMFRTECAVSHLYNFDPVGTACTEQVLFADSFENGLGNWAQDSQQDWFSSTQRDANGSRSAEVDGTAADAALVSPEIDLSGFGGATIQFSWYIESSLDSGEYLGFDVSTDGGQHWVEKATLRGNVDQESTWHKVMIAEPGADSLVLRFRGKMSSSTEDSNVDDVIVKPLPKGVSNVAPTADFDYTPASCDAGQPVSFTDTSSDDDGTIMSWTWNFGDGNGSTQKAPTHSYAESGSYTVKLTVTDDDGATGDVTRIVNVTPANVAPSADFDYNPVSPEVGQTVSFSDASDDDDGTIMSWTWDFGDGSGSTQQAPAHSYAESGSYVVKLTVTDDDGATDDVTRNVNVTPATNLEVFADSFEDGLGDWVEDSQNDWFSSSQRAADGNRSAEVDGSATDASLVSPEIDVNGHGDATVGFSWYIESGLDSGEYLGFDVSTDGGQTWVEKARLKGNVDQESTWHDVRIDLPGVDSLMLRFRGNMSRSNEDANIDKVFVTFSPKQQVFADSFEDGLGDWVEDSQNDWFSSSQRAADGNRSAEVDGSATDATLVSPEIDLNGHGDATVGFSWYIESGLDSGEYLGFDVSTDGGQTWIEKARLKGNVDQESTWHDVRIDLPGVDSLMLRFRGKMSRSNEDANIDNVFVTFSPK